MKKLLIFVVAYQAEETIKKVISRIPAGISSDFETEVLIVDDGSHDNTFRESRTAARDPEAQLKINVLFNPVNQGYGGNQKIGYHYAVENGFDYVALLHGDGQYAPECLSALLAPLASGQADAVFGSRMLDRGGALRGGMPHYKFIGNKILTFLQNRILGMSLSEFHSGYRIYSVAALARLPFERNSNGFHFDTEIIIQLHLARMRIVELPIPTYYGTEISRVDGIRYAKDVIRASLQAKLQGANLFYDRRYDCTPTSDGSNYPSKLAFDSTHSRIVSMIPSGSRVLDLGSGAGLVGKALKDKGCYVAGCDLQRAPATEAFDSFTEADLNRDLPVGPDDAFDHIICLDVIEHLASPEEFLDRLRVVAARLDATIIITTANVAFAPIRFSLLLGRFEYGKRGILDLTHMRLFTFSSLRRTLRSAGFDVIKEAGVVPPLPFVLGRSLVSGLLLKFAALLCRLWPAMFGFQILTVAKALPTLSTLLEAAKNHADLVSERAPPANKSARPSEMLRPGYSRPASSRATVDWDLQTFAGLTHD